MANISQIHVHPAIYSLTLVYLNPQSCASRDKVGYCLLFHSDFNMTIIALLRKSLCELVLVCLNSKRVGRRFDAS